MALRSNNIGNFLPTTQVWDTSEIYSTSVTSPEFKELLVRMYQNLNRMAISLNLRDAGIYDLQEFVNGQIYFPNPAFNSSTPQQSGQRQVFRKVVNFGPLPEVAGTTSIPHGIGFQGTVLGTPNQGTNAGFSFTRIYGAATDPTDLEYVPLPYASATNDNIELWADQLYVNVKVNSTTWAAYTTCYVILEYLKY